MTIAQAERFYNEAVNNVYKVLSATGLFSNIAVSIFLRKNP